MKADLRLNMWHLKEHPMNIIRKYITSADAVASIPMADAWFIWGAEWTGDLPNEFKKIESNKKENPYYSYGMFTEGINGTRRPLDEQFFREVDKC